MTALEAIVADGPALGSRCDEHGVRPTGLVASLVVQGSAVSLCGTCGRFTLHHEVLRPQRVHCTRCGDEYDAISKSRLCHRCLRPSSHTPAAGTWTEIGSAQSTDRSPDATDAVVALTALAARLASSGHSIQETFSDLALVNRVLCRPPLDARDLAMIVRATATHGEIVT